MINLFSGNSSAIYQQRFLNNLKQIRPSVEHGLQPNYSMYVNTATDSLDVYEI